MNSPDLSPTRSLPEPETGCTYTIWANGEGVTVHNAHGMRMHDAGSHVRCIPLCDVKHVAALLSAFDASPDPQETDNG